MLGATPGQQLIPNKIASEGRVDEDVLKIYLSKECFSKASESPHFESYTKAVAGPPQKTARRGTGRRGRLQDLTFNEDYWARHPTASISETVGDLPSTTRRVDSR